MTMTTGNFSRLIAPGYRKVFFGQMKDRPTEYDKIINIKSSTRAYEDDFEMAGVGAMQSKSEGVAINYSDPIQGGTKRYTHAVFGRGYRITEEMYEDDLYSVTGQKMAKSLAKAVANHCEVYGWSVLNNAFNTSYAGFIASTSLCSTSHTLIDGSTLANRPSAETDLSATALQAAIESFEGWTDNRGLPVLIKPVLLVVGPTFKWAAREILGSEFRPYSSDNEINSLREEDMKYMVGHFLSDADSWFVLGGKDDHDMNWQWRRKPKFENSDDFDTGDAKFKVSLRHSQGYGDFRGVYGSQGA